MKNKKFWVALVAGVMAAIMILSLLLSILPTQVHAASSSEIKQHIEELEKKNEEMQNQINDLKDQQADNLSEIQQIVAQKNLIQQQIGLLHAQVNNMNEQIAAYNVLIADKQEELNEAQARLDELNEKNKERIRAMEEDGELSYWEVLFQANSFADLLDRLNMVEEIAAADQRRLKEMEEAAQLVEDAKAALSAEREELKRTKEEMTVIQAEMEVKNQEAKELLSQLVAKGEEFNNLMSDLEDDLAELEEEIAKEESAYDDAVHKEHMATATTKPVYRPGPGSANNYGAGVGGNTIVDESGITWVVPCDYRKVSSAFGMRIHPVYKDWRHHNGVDLDADCLMHDDGTTDSPIYASRAGVVSVSKWSDSAGWYVTIDHLDGYKTVYMHMCCRPFVRVGDIVAAGEVIGCIGTTGTSTGDHLHFGVLKNGTYVNPMEYIA